MFMHQAAGDIAEQDVFLISAKYRMKETKLVPSTFLQKSRLNINIVACGTGVTLGLLQSKVQDLHKTISWRITSPFIYCLFEKAEKAERLPVLKKLNILIAEWNENNHKNKINKIK